jgi:F-type H+-transporting ATPase subunit delta
MSKVIANRYVSALLDGVNVDEHKVYVEAFTGLSAGFESRKLADIINSSDIDVDKKASIFLEAVKSLNNQRINNLIKLLAEQKRLEIIPTIAEALSYELAKKENVYNGVISSKSSISDDEVTALAVSLGEKIGSKISLTYNATDYDGIKVEVKDLGVEVSFSKDRVRNDMISHILKAI